ncbi:MAG TPA: metal-dependent hydrolase [Bacillota bacterium]|nr:metal-dependent hydrolase [Bacillota bacterium]
MRGRTHLTIGILTGLGLSALFPQIPLSVTGVTIAGISSLATDLDEPRGMLGQKIAVSPWRIKSALWSLGVAIVLYAYLSFQGMERNVFAGLGVFLILLGWFLKERNARRIALVLTGMGLLTTGAYLHFWWLGTLGIFVAISPFFKHRTWCHSLLGATIWAVIWFQAESSLQINGATWYAVSGYLSHLVADSLTKSGVMWFYPWKGAFKVPLISTGSKSGAWFEWMICVAYGMGIAALYGIHFSLT